MMFVYIGQPIVITNVVLQTLGLVCLTILANGMPAGNELVFS